MNIEKIQEETQKISNNSNSDSEEKISNEKFENVKTNLFSYYNSQLKELKKLKEQLLEAQKNNDTKKVDCYSRKIGSILDNINRTKNKLSCMRLNNVNDLNERKDIMTNFPKLVNEIIPNDVPIVFHGNNNIETVKQIISSGGLYTPEERGTSSETRIYVTYKSNIKVSCEYADSGLNVFMPYGAIFVFYSKEHEYETVLQTGEEREVFGGVESINFNESRFVGIITTTENLEDLKKYMKENNLDSNKVFTYNQFLDFCNDRFIAQTKISK